MKPINLERVFTILVASSSVLSIGWIIYRRQQRQKKSLKIEDMQVPSEWKKIGEIGELILYPLKGAKRKCITSATCSKLGLRENKTNPYEALALQDRVFVVYNKKQEYLNMRKNSNMLFVETSSIDKYNVKFSFPNAEDLIVKIPNNPVMAKIVLWYGENVETVDCGEAAAEWFSQRLTAQRSGLRLGCFVQALVPPRSMHPVWDEFAKVYSKFHSDYLGAYSESASYLFLSEESVNDLNKRLENPVSQHNFRPNIVVKGSPAYAEDSWDWIKIGDQVIMRTFKYCTRCIITTMNPDTADYDPSMEPLQTLRKYRQLKDPDIQKLEGYSPVMGMYAGLHSTGIVHVGDPVYVA